MKQSLEDSLCSLWWRTVLTFGGDLVPSQGSGVSLGGIKPSRHQNDIRRELLGNGHHHRPVETQPHRLLLTSRYRSCCSSNRLPLEDDTSHVLRNHCLKHKCVILFFLFTTNSNEKICFCFTAGLCDLLAVKCTRWFIITHQRGQKHTAA